MDVEIREIVEKALEKAQEQDACGNVGRAYAYYTVVAELCPAKRSEVEKLFTDVLCKLFQGEWGMQLELGNRIEDAVTCYKHSLNIYPNNTRMLNNFAAHLLRNNNPIEAIQYLKLALQVDSNFLPAERNLQNAFSMAVDRWHFPMLNDTARNRGFRRAIQKRIAQGYDVVLDIGTGTGLLSLYAHEAGAKEIYACECSPVMGNVARNVFSRNNAGDIKLFPKSSENLCIPQDIPNRVNLIITETFDAGLFGECVIPTLIDAHENLFVGNNLGMVIPLGATLYVAAVESEHIRSRSTILFNKSDHPSFLNFDNVSVLVDDEFYDTENLENVNVNYVTEPKEIVKVNFNDLSVLRTFSGDGEKGMVNVKCRYDGIIDGLVAWFKLNIDEDITLNSSQGKSCWQQAIFPAIPRICKQRDHVEISAEILNGKLNCSYKLVTDTTPKMEPIFRLPKEVITFLNDFDYVISLVRIAKHQKNEPIKYVLDTSPFPVYGLTLLKENRNCEKLYCEANSLALQTVLHKVATDSGITSLIEPISNYSEINNKIDAILIHNFDAKGELKDRDQQNYHDFLDYFLNNAGFILQQKIFLMGQLVYSTDLPKMVRVNDKHVQGHLRNSKYDMSADSKNEPGSTIHSASNDGRYFFVAECINEFEINQVFDLNSSMYECRPSTNAVTLTQLDDSETNESLVNFGKISVPERAIPNALICWYEIQLAPEHIHSTRRCDSFMNHTAVVLEDHLRELVLQDKEITFKVYQMNGLVRVTLVTS
nr:protein arginine N-methyltransferase 9-like isoform X1 [Neodiprion pinetum]